MPVCIPRYCLRGSVPRCCSACTYPGSSDREREPCSSCRRSRSCTDENSQHQTSAAEDEGQVLMQRDKQCCSLPRTRSVIGPYALQRCQWTLDMRFVQYVILQVRSPLPRFPIATHLAMEAAKALSLSSVELQRRVVGAASQYA